MSNKLSGKSDSYSLQVISMSPLNITTFANEILDEIFVHLEDASDLFNLCNTHRSFKASAQQFLFRHVHLPAQYLKKLDHEGSLARALANREKRPYQTSSCNDGTVPTFDLPEFGADYKPKTIQTCANFADVVARTPHLLAHIQVLRLDVAVDPILFKGDLILESEVLTALIPQMKNLRQLIVRCLEQPIWLSPLSTVVQYIHHM